MLELSCDDRVIHRTAVRDEHRSSDFLDRESLQRESVDQSAGSCSSISEESSRTETTDELSDLCCCDRRDARYRVSNDSEST
tara:strand:+ start:3783 stop:4028 length:246 start_codon:yes stop_codon:yes gene_type:complete